ncbi:dUTP diphosphatase [Patellaria atrata CBS 101060]|uniref:Deoxyuridine 5'-triphosphate nucleotidohydrolase n=1 Tax=Patellaria atrata CBS 101060 TaxID=1346257 RepID=A0A9P4S5M7_9PEZI|nr:dUTP diphosphatase [Patellaria atrata CBS 101060]
MAEETSTPAPAITHEPPSLPSSPLPKRTKIIDPTVTASIASAIPTDSRTATPTPTSMSSTAPNVPSLAPAAPITDISAPPPLQIKKLSEKGRAPTRGSAFAAGYDIYSAQSTTVPARGKALVETDIAIAVPPGTYGRIAPRSGLASKHSINVGAGVIDADYRGPLKILLFNLSDTDFSIAEGDRIAQLILERIWTPEVLMVEELEESARGVGGFGSTGGFGTPSGVV